MVIIGSLVPIYVFGIMGAVPFKVPSRSMEPTLLPGDYLFATPEEYYHRGDIIVLRDPTQKGAYLVKRLVGLPGDTISEDNGYLSINGKYASEPYLFEPVNYVLVPVTVPENEILVLGDNRNESEDSSRWLIDPDTGEVTVSDEYGNKGPDGKNYKRTVPISSVIGKVRYIYLPFSRAGKVESYPLVNVDGE
ncbi:MAG: signal peptidase I [Candidatus Hydrogenedentes bacterium]|nr:signal peptidase I [Candidatus Hydrogenedentota bacterium]